MSRRRNSRLVTAGVLAALFASLTTGAGVAMAGKTTRVFATFDTPGTYSWTVPKGVRRVSVHLFGAQGGPNADLGGLGGETIAQVAVTPGQALQIVVGGTTTDFVGGFNGGGAGAQTFLPAAGGGGASDVRIGACAATKSCGLTARVVVAGGGGGAGCYASGDAGSGGGGGGTAGLPGYGSVCGSFTGSGGGGTQTAGGACDTPLWPCDGVFGAGGTGAGEGSAGGGGGWFGGAGGWNAAGGAGGSGYVGPSTLGGQSWPSVRVGNGSVVISAP